MKPCRRALQVAVACALLFTAAFAHGQVYKCKDGTGKTIYADAPCASGGQRLALPNDAKGSAAGATACAQLLDETRRLAAEADRDARRGRSQSAGSAKRRQALLEQYQRRCAGISRSIPDR